MPQALKCSGNAERSFPCHPYMTCIVFSKRPKIKMGCSQYEEGTKKEMLASGLCLDYIYCLKY